MAVTPIDTQLEELISQGLPDTTYAGSDHRVVELLTQIITLLNDLEDRVVVLETP